MPVPVEACVEAASEPAVRRSVRAAHAGGAARVELCADLAAGGLTPALALVRAARKAFEDRPGLLVMIRPRAGDFHYSPDERATMQASIHAAADARADGVVLGAVRDGRLDDATLTPLLDAARTRGLSVTFHRAFDALADPEAALPDLAARGVDRVLTSGTPWPGGGGALDGADRLAAYLHHAAPRPEIVAGGGLGPDNVAALLARLPADAPRLSVHAYSSLLRDGLTDAVRVAAMVRATGEG